MRIHRLILVENAQRLGVPGVLGTALAVSCLGFALAALWPASRDLAATKTQVAAAQARAAGQRSGPARPSASEELAAFYGALPPQAEATKSIERIYAIAKKEGVALDKGEYSLVADQNAPLARYQIVLPVRSDYRRIRRFIRTALGAVPSLGLEDVSLQRQRIGEVELDARIRMTLYVRRT